jgi:hypothetical protein
MINWGTAALYPPVDAPYWNQWFNMTADGKKLPVLMPPPLYEALPVRPDQLAVDTELTVTPEELVAPQTAAAGLPDTLVQPETETAEAVKLNLADTCACRYVIPQRLSNRRNVVLFKKVI